MKILSVVGARPQFIKAMPLSLAIRERHEEVLVHTGQHYDRQLSDVFFEQLPLPEPEYELGIGSGPHAVQTAEMMTQLHHLIVEEAPDVVLVYGDTNSTLAGALVASKLPPLLAHVEAGLRSYNWEMPEEVNRVVTDHCSDLLFTPTDRASAILEAESVRGAVHCVGDVMYDALRMVEGVALEQSTVLSSLDLTDDEYVLATVHRASNTDDPERLGSIIDGLAASPRPVVLPAHPRTVDALQRHGLWERATTELQIVEPVGYVDFLRLIAGAHQVATDSGGVQKEAFYLDTPCVTLREETEWVETVECGWNTLVGADPVAIERALAREDSPSSKPTLYGDGTAAETIVELLEHA